MIDLSLLLLSTVDLVLLVFRGVRRVAGEGGWSDEERLELVSGALDLFTILASPHATYGTKSAKL